MRYGFTSGIWTILASKINRSTCAHQRHAIVVSFVAVIAANESQNPTSFKIRPQLDPKTVTDVTKTVTGGGGFYLGSQAFNQVDPGLRVWRLRSFDGSKDGKTYHWPVKHYHAKACAAWNCNCNSQQHGTWHLRIASDSAIRSVRSIRSIRRP
jgi:hypothetical protein